MAKIHEREKAIQFRKQGQSIKEIATSLGISKSTVSTWCKNIKLSKKQIAEIAKRSSHKATESLLKSAEKKREERLRNIKEAGVVAKRSVGKISERDIKMIGLGLYWGEGYKRGSQELGFTNSDPEMIKFYIKWLSTIFEIKKDRLILRISINHIHGERIEEVTDYWSKVTGVPRAQFTKPSLIKASSRKKYTNTHKHFGTLRIKVRKGTQLRREILAAIDLLKNTSG